MIEQSLARLQHLCETIPPLLYAIEDAAFSEKSAPDKWSKKQIIGHLIDSATNNHQRFVRAQFEELPHITYDQNNWNTFGYYQQMGGSQVISFWTAYNKHLLDLIRLIPLENLKRECSAGGTQHHSLAFLIDDYVAHLEHHLKQVVNYD